MVMEEVGGEKRGVLRVFEGFAGYGGGSFALKNLRKKYPEFEAEVVAYSENNKYAVEIFDRNHRDKSGNIIKNFRDFTKIDPEDENFPDFDLFIGGFPSQAFSTVGRQMGKDDPQGRGTLFEHVMRICKVKKPKYVLMENVKGLLSRKFDETRRQMEMTLREMGYVADPDDPGESPLKMAVLNSKDYGIPQNRERVWMLARRGGLPKDFSMTPPVQPNEKRLGDFLDPEGCVPEDLYLTKKQIEHLKEKHGIESFIVEQALCFDVYNKKIRTDGYAMTITMPEHNNLRVIEPHADREVVRKMSATEQFRLMGLEGLAGVEREVEIDFCGHSYTQLSKRAADGWDVNLVTILFEHIFRQLEELDEEEFKFNMKRKKVEV